MYFPFRVAKQRWHEALGFSPRETETLTISIRPEEALASRLPAPPAPLQGAGLVCIMAFLALKCQASCLRCFAALLLWPMAAIGRTR